MGPKKRAEFAAFNVDLLPFDNGCGCGGLLNRGVCDCGGTKSHACPLKKCAGVIHPEGFKLFHKMNWKCKPLKEDDLAKLRAPVDGAAASATGAKPKGKGKGKGK